MMHTPTSPIFLGIIFLIAAPVQADDFFEKKIRPVLVEQCFRCHGPERQRGGLRLDSREHALTGGDTGPAMVVGKPSESLLLKAVRHEEDMAMPPEGKLTEDQIKALDEWIKNGAKWPESASAKSDKPRYKPGTMGPEERAWWAIQKVTKPSPPIPASTPIDAFLDVAREKAGLKASSMADKATLIRRLSFDLNGLPPTPAEIDAFLADESNDAYDQLVERLLAKPEYGARAARLWLDLVRYADSDGYREDKFRPDVWQYRDYVIRSFNADKPYSRFVQEQIAGDELFPNDPDALRATGYLRLWQYEYNQRDVKGQFSFIMNDITDVTADVFLGLGMGCARCHDHKFDPILQKDYFRLQAFFSNVDFRQEAVFDSDHERAVYQSKLNAWEAKTAAIRGKMDAMVQSIREKEMKRAADIFPTEIQPIFKKSPKERTPREQQLYDLAFRQVTLEFERAGTKLPKDKKAEYEKLEKELAALSADKPGEPIMRIVRDLGTQPAETLIPDKSKLGPVDPGFLTIIDPDPAKIEPKSNSTGRRATLANWMTNSENPLTARVIVNRIWQQHFGKGIVATPSDFGRLGEKPSHPELLDWLTADFIENGWSIKQLHRRIVKTEAYKQSSFSNDPVTGKLKDPENRLIWKMPVRRLDAEQVRDAMLLASNELLPHAFGSPADASKPLRSIYTKQIRNAPNALLAAFDGTDGLTSCACRNTTTTATQSLLLLNGEDVLARASSFAKSVLAEEPKDAGKRVRLAYQRAYGRLPSTEEENAARAFLTSQARKAMGQKAKMSDPVTPEARVSAYVDFCHVLLNSSEFLYVD
jgi:hypothetical protein